MFIPIEDNNWKDLGAATISRWICITIVDSHATLQNSKSIPGRLKHMSSLQFITTFQQSRPTSSDVPVEAPSCPSNLETSVCKLTVYARQVIIAAGEIMQISSGLRQMEFLSVGVLYSCHPTVARTGRLPSLICQILVLSKMSCKLFELLLTELKFMDRK